MITIVGVAFTTKILAGKAGKFFIGQQKSLGAVNGYIEEMITGQKVVKVFNREEICKEEFDKLNETLCENAFSAGKFSNMMGPINNNLGYVQYAILAIVGGAIAVNNDAIVSGLGLKAGTVLLTLGSLMAFMQLSRNFNMPINQVSQQFNSIIMALAGAERIFEVMDQEPEVDDGYVTLVNARIDENGNVTEAAERTGTGPGSISTKPTAPPLMWN
jgi:ATP-binding cassette subfamily B protein